MLSTTFGQCQVHPDVRSHGRVLDVGWGRRRSFVDIMDVEPRRGREHGHVIFGHDKLTAAQHLGRDIRRHIMGVPLSNGLRPNSSRM